MPSKGQEAFDEPPVEVGMSNEGLYIAEGPGRFPLLDGRNHLGVDFQALRRDDLAWECDFLDMEPGLNNVDLESCFSQLLQYSTNLGQVLGKGYTMD